MQFKMAEDKKLFWLSDENWTSVEIKACFPNSHPNKYLSVRNDKGVELALIEKLEDLSVEARSIVHDYLKFKSFVFEIIGIYKIEEDFGLRSFEVKTKSGDRCFQMALDDWPEVNSRGNIHLEDLHGEQYSIENLEFGAKILSAYV